ncbi:MAG: GTPase HflX [Deltaproteobacteria bacterium]|nr:GTPase HflX [Deltaproteobacteria bacterium]MCF8118776.1 GTPase HflX [Deltaproteobacteria bacterium]
MERMEAHNTTQHTLLMGVCLSTEALSLKDVSMDELERLADTAGMKVRDRCVQRRQKISGRTYVGQGFIGHCLENMDDPIDVLIFDNDLTGSQARNIEALFEVEVMDRSELILKIFHNHARTKEARLQVRLAELKYQLPKLRHMWSHLDRERGSSRMGGGAAVRGMGEKQIEMDRQKVQREIYEIEKDLKRLSRQLHTQRKLRKRTCWNIGLVGYTNTGKSTLFNRLTHSAVLVQDRLFATLDTTSRSLNLGRGRDIILSDTVGFVAGLPHHLVASFRATLKEAEEADLLIHVADISDRDLEKHMADVKGVLEEIGAGDIPYIRVFNKIDKVDPAVIRGMKRRYPDAHGISAKNGTHIQGLLDEIERRINHSRTYELKIPQGRPKIISDVHAKGKIVNKAYDNDFVRITVEMSPQDMHSLDQYVVNRPQGG